MDVSVTQSGKYKIIKVSDRIDWENARELDGVPQKALEEGYHHLVFNLEEVTFICSGGIGALVYNHNKARKEGGALYIISSNEYVNYIFETLRFDVVFKGHLFKSYDDFYREIVENDRP